MDPERRNSVIAIVLIGLGALFLAGQLFGISLGALLWPWFIILPGLVLGAAAFIGGRQAAPLAIPGSIVTMIGLIMLVQSLTGHFESWAYAWALIVASVGIGIFLMAALAGDEEQRRQGIRLAGVGLALFVGFGLFFELLIFGNVFDTFAGRVLLPLLLVGAGVFLLMRREPRKAGAAPRQDMTTRVSQEERPPQDFEKRPPTPET